MYGLHHPIVSNISTVTVELQVKLNTITEFLKKKLRTTSVWYNQVVWKGSNIKITWIHELTDRVLQLSNLRTATSFLKACNCAGVGLVTLSLFTATAPCHCPLNTVPNDPDPIRGPKLISSFGISQSSFESLQPPWNYGRYEERFYPKNMVIGRLFWSFSTK